MAICTSVHKISPTATAFFVLLRAYSLIKGDAGPQTLQQVGGTLEHYWQIYWASYWNYTSKRFTGPVNPVTGSNVDTGPVNR